MPTQKQTKKSTKRAINKKRTVTKRRRITERLFESDSTYFLKLVIVVILGTLWLKFQSPLMILGFPFYGLPLGLLVGIIAIKYLESYQADRKIWYAVLIVIGLLSFFAPQAGVWI